MAPYIPWTITCEVVVDKSPFDDPAGYTWVETSTPLAFSMRRGKQDKLGEFQPGSAVITFDNWDYHIDQLITGSDFGDGHAWPGTPMRVKAEKGATTKYLFSGFTVDGFEPQGSPKGGGTAVVVLTDWMGWAQSVDFPGSQWEAWVQSARPDFWWRGELSQSASTSGVLYDFAQRWTGVSGDMTWSANGTFSNQSSLVPGTSGFALRTSTTAGVQGTYAMTANAPAAAGQWGLVAWIEATVAQSFSIGVAGSWSIGTNASGHAVATVVDNAVTYTATIAVDHCDGDAHMWRLSVVSSGAFGFHQITLDTDLGTATQVIAAGNYNTGGGLITINGSDSTLIDEVAYWSSTIVPDALTLAATPITLTNWKAGTPNLWLGDTVADRADSVCAAALAASPDWEINLDDPAGELLWYLSTANTLADVIRSMATSFLGDVWVTRAGAIRLRDALFASTSADDYTTVLAKITDNPASTYPPTVVRPSSRSRTGTRRDRVINQVSVTFFSVVTNDLLYIDFPSLARFGESSKRFTSQAYSDAPVIPMATALLAANADPVVELGELTIKPWGDQDVTAWVMEDLELERPIYYREATPDNSVEIINATHRIIYEAWDWSKGTDWTVKLRLAPV